MLNKIKPPGHVKTSLKSDFFLLRIFRNYISNAIPKVPHTPPPTSLPYEPLSNDYFRIT